MSAPDHITEFVCEDCGDHVHVFGHYYGLPGHSTCPLHPRTSDMPSTSSRGICEATLSRVAKRKRPSPRCCHPSEDPRKTKMDDETRRYCVLRFPFASNLFFGSYPESCRFFIYVAWSPLLTPPDQTTGDGPPPANAFGFIGRAYGFGFIAAVDAFGF